MFSQNSSVICNKPIYKIILIAAVIVVVLGILLLIGFSNHYYSIKCRDAIDEYSSKLHYCTSEIFNQTEGFKQLELSLIQYNYTRELGFKILKCLYGIQPVDDDCDEKPAAERLFNIHTAIIETIQFLCIDSYDKLTLMENINLNECDTESLKNYEQCIKLQQHHNNVTELNSFMNQNICRNFDIKRFCNKKLNLCFSIEQMQLVESTYINLKLSFPCP